MLKDTNYYVNFGEHLKKSDPNSLYVHKNGFRYSVLHIYPKTGNDNGKMDLVVIKQVFEYLQKTVPSSWRLLEDKGTQGYDLITVDELKHYVQLLLNSPEIETMLKTKKK